MDKQNSSAYTGRFGDHSASAQRKVNPVPRSTPKDGDDVRRPSGFGSTGQAARRKPAAKQAAPSAEETKKAPKPKKERKPRKERVPREKKPRRGLKILATAVIILLMAAAAIVLVFGHSGTYHMMPIVQREEAQPSFAPDQTPMPGLEVS